MTLSAQPFVYELPDDRIAQRPIRPYDAARMLVVNRESGSCVDSYFRDLAEFVRPEDVFVINDTRVVSARLFGTRHGDTSPTEILILKPKGDPATMRWECIGKPQKRLSLGSTFSFGPELSGTIVSDDPIEIQFVPSNTTISFVELLDRIGRVPIPPYIRKGLSDAEDRIDYQTRFARHAGSVAAPTASLHFTTDLIKKLEARGCAFEYLTLHLSRASFAPLWREEEDTSALVPPGGELLSGDPSMVTRLQARRKGGGRVIAVGTSVVRSLETIARNPAWSGACEETSLFISPPFSFQFVDAVVTNFHQPRTTHLLLVEALLGRSLLAESYSHALRTGYRFLSYGDGMLILGSAE